MNRAILFLFFFIVSHYDVIAQKKNFIVDSITKEPIAFATVVCNEAGTMLMSNEKGEYFFADSVTGCETVIISCAGYQTKKVKASARTVLLAPLIVDLPVVSVGSEKKESIFHNINKLNCSFGFIPDKFSVTHASFLPNPVGKSGWLKELSFHVSTFHKPDLEVPVRIRFFEWDETTQLPGKEISTTNLIIKPTKKNWNKLNLEKLKQEIPANRIVIAFELISAGPEHYHEYKYTDKQKQKHTGTYYGWNLTASCCTDCGITGFSFINNKWLLRKGTTRSNEWAPAVKLKMNYYN